MGQKRMKLNHLKQRALTRARKCGLYVEVDTYHGKNDPVFRFYVMSGSNMLGFWRPVSGMGSFRLTFAGTYKMTFDEAFEQALTKSGKSP
jgi:hypothetical protein